MGKAKKRRSNKSRQKANPMTGVAAMGPEVEPGPDGEEAVAAAPQQQQQQMLEGLDSLSASTREATCVALATVFGPESVVDSTQQRRRLLHKLMESGVVKKLIPRVVDLSMGTRLHALGALRNMSVVGDLDVCEYMTSQDVITPVIQVIGEVTQKPNFLLDSRLKDQLEQSISLLMNLCESCDQAVVHLTNTRVIPLIIQCLESDFAGSAIQLEASRFLFVITDNNLRLVEDIKNDPGSIQLISAAVTKESTPVLVRLNCCGTLLNMRNAINEIDILKQVLPVMEKVLAFNVSTTSSLATAASAAWEISYRQIANIEITEDAAAQEEVNKTNEETKRARIARQAWNDSVSILQLGLELSASVLASSDDEVVDIDDDESLEQFEAEGHAASEMCPSTSPASLLVASSSVFSNVLVTLESLKSLPNAVCLPIRRDIMVLRARACSCLSNILQGYPSNSISNGAEILSLLCQLHQTWSLELAQDDFSSINNSVNDVQAALTSAIWAIYRRSLKEGHILATSLEQVTTIIDIATKSSSLEARGNSYGVIGCIGRVTTGQQENLIIGNTLKQGLSDTSLQVVCECINSIFDVYGEEDHDEIFVGLGFLPSLSSVGSLLKDRIRSEAKKLDRELVAHVKETRMNLLRFIKYKQA